ncbi:MAG: discoidin domain-containing protein [Tannerella sp.]|jgi:hypothetical protein|nr:discoidin domain-containing protein [Tannerella sp.]
MIRRILFFCTLLTGILLTGCNDEQDTEFLEVSEENFDFLGEDGDGASFRITSNTQWNTFSSDAWLRCLPPSGEGDGGVAVSVEHNRTANTRSGTVTIVTSGGLSKIIEVTQLGSEPDIIARPVNPAPLPVGGQVSIRVTATDEWEVLIPGDAMGWVRVVEAETASLQGWAILEFDLNETDEDRLTDIVFKLKKANKYTVVNVKQPFIIPPANVELPNEVVRGTVFAITGENMNSVSKVRLGDTEVPITESASGFLRVEVPATFTDGTFDVILIYGTREMNIGSINVIPPFPKAEGPAEATIGTAFILHGSLLNLVQKVMIGSTEATFAPGRTPSASLLVTVPLSARAGEAEVKLIFDGNQESPVGVMLLKEGGGFDAGKDLCRYAGSRYAEADPSIPMVVEGGRTNGWNAGGGRSILFAFDGVIDNPTYDLVDYLQYYVGQLNWNGTGFGTTNVGGTGVPNRGRTYWQANSGQNQGMIDDGAEIPSNRTCFWLDYTTTPAGYVIFDRIALIGRGNNADATRSYTIEISDNNINWITVIKPEDSNEFVGTTEYGHTLPTPVMAKYVRYVVVEAAANNTGLTIFQLYRTK